jgi:hypothetical protein
MRAVTTLIVLTFLTGCSESSDAERAAPPARRVSEYAVLTSDAWTLQEAIDPPPDDPIAGVERPPLEWYSEYVRTVGNESQMVRLSGHQARLDETQAELESLGFGFADVAVEGWSAVGGSAPGDPSGPAIILLDGDEATLMLLSYELDLDELVGTATGIEPVSKAAWVDAGGVIR